MGWVWQSSGVGTYTLASQTVEISAAVGSLLVSSGEAPWDWHGRIPASAGISELEAIQIDEIREAVDFLVDHNDCSTHYSSHCVSVCPTHQGTYNSGHLSNVDSSVLANVMVTHDHSYCSTNLSSEHNSYLKSNNSSQQSTDHYSRMVSVNSSRMSTVLLSNLNGHFNAWNIVDNPVEGWFPPD